MKSKPLIVGIVIDVSQSMKKNWQPLGRNAMPKIEVIRDSLNLYFEKASKLNINRNIEIFCFGYGFSLTQAFVSMKNENGYEREINNSKKTYTRCDIVCDLLALSEMVPTKQELESLKKNLNDIWNNYADDIIGNIQIDDSLNIKLPLFISGNLIETAEKNWRYTLYKKYVNQSTSKFVKTLLSLSPIKLENWNVFIEDLSKKEAKRYFKDIHSHTQQLFKDNKQKYTNLVIDTLTDFANSQINFMLSAHAFGYSIKSIIKYFNKEKAYEFALEIFNEIKKDVNKSIITAWKMNRLSLLKTEKIIGAQIDSSEVKELTEIYIKNYGWSILKPFIEKKVYEIFLEAFEKQAKAMIPSWISYASSRETVKSIKQIVALLPETSKKVVYSSDFMFGSSPMENAMDRVTMKFLDNKYKNREKILILITDGEFSSNLPIYSASMLKNEGVTIVSCQISNENIIQKITSSINPNWSKSAKVLFEMSSKVEDNQSLEKLINERKIKVPDKSKLFFQINQPEHLNEIMKAIYN